MFVLLINKWKMGKDQELLEAARSGNVTVVEKILGQRAKRSGPLARWVSTIIILITFYYLFVKLFINLFHINSLKIYMIIINNILDVILTIIIIFIVNFIILKNKKKKQTWPQMSWQMMMRKNPCIFFIF